MFRFSLRDNIIYFALIICLNGKSLSSEIPRPRGIPLSRLPLYSPDSDTFTCIDGSLTIPYNQVNDDYCDCIDGSDEPGTSACPNGSFYCTNAGHRPLIVPSSRVNDGICDCCDASDEYGFPNSKCINNCYELGKTARLEAQKKAEILKLGSQIRAELIQKGVQIKQEKKERLLILNRSKNEAELIKKEKEQIKMDAEQLENVALEKYKIIEDEQKKLKEMQENEKLRKEALDAFMIYDTNQDGKLEISEIQTRPAFDRDRDGVITEQEAQYFLDDKTEMNFEEFLETAWPKMKPYHMISSGIFKPPLKEGESLSEADDMNQNEDEEEDLDHEQDLENGPDHDDQEHEPEEHENEDGEAEHENGDHLEGDEHITDTSIEYDEETNRLIGQAQEARKAFTEADRALRDLQNEIKSIEDSIQKDMGPEEEFLSLENQCFEYTDREYVYKLCPFNEVTQTQKSGGSETRLGQWGSWVGNPNKYSEMHYVNGASCWNGPQRSTLVKINCASESVITSVTEPNRCEYVFEFSTPAACNPHLEKNEDFHDEL